MSVRIAVISDLHCQSKDSSPNESFLYYDADPTPRNRHPVESLIQLIQDKDNPLSADALLIPGDLTNAMCTHGLVGGWDYALRISRELGAGLVAATLGNHDVDSMGNLGPDPFQFPRERVERGFPVGDDMRRGAYWASGFCMVEYRDLQALVINSAAEHQSFEKAKRGGVTERRLEEIEDFLLGSVRKPFRVALFHHHPMLHEGCGLGSEDVMCNGSLLLDVLEKHDFDLVIHGHKHHPRLIYGPGGANSIAVLAAGSLAANNARNPGLNTITRNLFHIVTLEDEGVDRHDRCGTMESWEFGMGDGWQLPNRQSARIPSKTGFGCRVRPHELAQQAAATLCQSGEKWLQWDRMLAAMPQLRYLIPLDLEAFDKSLQTDHKMRLYPAPPDHPDGVGRLEGGEA